MNALYPNCPARVMSFIGGPATHGPGMVIDNDKANVIRSWMDIDKDNVKFMKKAIRYYKSLAVRAATAGHAIDIIAACFDQTGLHEMKTLCNSTGGHLVMTDSFKSTLFAQTFQRIFNCLATCKSGTSKFSGGFNFSATCTSYFSNCFNDHCSCK